MILMMHCKRSYAAAIALLSVSLLASSGLASAAGLSYYGIETEVDRMLVVYTTATLVFDEPVNHLDYNVDFPVINLSVEVESGMERCSLDSAGKGSTISCDFYGMEEGESKVQLSFHTRNAVKRVGDGYEFRATYPISMPTSRVFSLIKLPPTGALSNDIANQSYFPPDGKILTDGRHMIIQWEDRNLTADDSLSYSVLFEVGEAGGIVWDLSVIGLTVVVVIAMIAVAVYLRRGSSPGSPEVKVLPLLNKDEKRLVDILAKQGGEARQRLLVKESDFSKAKVSRLVKNLKERGVIDTEPISGRENKVILSIKGVGE
jgi:hypothetical protein